MALRIGLVSSASDLGVMVVRSLLVKLLREQHPAARIVVLTEAEALPAVKDFYEHNSWVDECVAFETERPRSVAARLQLWRWLRAQALDIIVLNPQSRFPQWLPRLCGIPTRIGLADGRTARRYFTHPATLDVPDSRDLHWVRVVESYARALGVRDFKGPAAHVPFLRVERRTKAPRRRCPRIVVHVGGSPHWNRRWPRDQFARLCTLLVQTMNASIGLVGSASDTPDNRAIVTAVRAADPGADVTDISGGSVAATARQIADADLFVGNDSGPMNIAVAVGTPVVAIRGADPENFRADVVDARHIVLSNWTSCARYRNGTADCDRGCPVAYDRERQTYPACMAAIPFERVWRAVERQLARRSRTAPARAVSVVH